METYIQKILDTGSLFQIFPEYKSYFYILLLLVFIRPFRSVFGKMSPYCLSPVLGLVMLFTYLGMIPIKWGYFLFVCIFVCLIWSICDIRSSDKPKDGLSDDENKHRGRGNAESDG